MNTGLYGQEPLVASLLRVAMLFAPSVNTRFFLGGEVRLRGKQGDDAGHLIHVEDGQCCQPGVNMSNWKPCETVKRPGGMKSEAHTSTFLH